MTALAPATVQSHPGPFQSRADHGLAAGLDHSGSHGGPAPGTPRSASCRGCARGSQRTVVPARSCRLASAGPAADGPGAPPSWSQRARAHASTRPASPACSAFDTSQRCSSACQRSTIWIAPGNCSDHNPGWVSQRRRRGSRPRPRAAHAGRRPTRPNRCRGRRRSRWRPSS